VSKGTWMLSLTTGKVLGVGTTTTKVSLVCVAFTSSTT
jgi:ribosomal protein L18E